MYSPPLLPKNKSLFFYPFLLTAPYASSCQVRHTHTHHPSAGSNYTSHTIVTNGHARRYRLHLSFGAEVRVTSLTGYGFRSEYEKGSNGSSTARPPPATTLVRLPAIHTFDTYASPVPTHTLQHPPRWSRKRTSRRPAVRRASPVLAATAQSGRPQSAQAQCRLPVPPGRVPHRPTPPLAFLGHHRTIGGRGTCPWRPPFGHCAWNRYVGPERECTLGMVGRPRRTAGCRAQSREVRRGVPECDGDATRLPSQSLSGFGGSVRGVSRWV